MQLLPATCFSKLCDPVACSSGNPRNPSYSVLARTCVYLGLLWQPFGGWFPNVWYINFTVMGLDHKPWKIKLTMFDRSIYIEEAYTHMAAKCFAHKLKLFRLRPKLHFQQHLTLLMGPESAPVAFSALSFWVCIVNFLMFCKPCSTLFGNECISMIPKTVFGVGCPTKTSAVGPTKTT